MEPDQTSLVEGN